MTGVFVVVCSHCVLFYIRSTGANNGTGTANPAGAPEFTPRLIVGFVLLDL